jgi:hypothetical protein
MPLAQDADAVAHVLQSKRPCEALAAARRLRAETQRDVNNGQIDTGLREPLLSSIDALTENIPCERAVTRTSTGFSATGGSSEAPTPHHSPRVPSGATGPSGTIGAG